MRRSVALTLLWLLLPLPTHALDHLDGPGVQANPAADIGDLFAWMSPDQARVNLLMTVFPLATTTSKFSSFTHYVFHTASRSAFSMAAASAVDVICDFQGGSPQATQCWVGSTAYVAGDATAAAGLSSANGQVRVFAGLRDDPDFFNAAGFNAFRQSFTGAAGSLSIDAAGCPGLNSPVATAFESQLNHGALGGAPTNLVASANVLAIVVSVDASLLTTGGPIVSVWASTNH